MAVGLVAVYVIFFSFSDEDTMMEDTTSAPSVLIAPAPETAKTDKMGGSMDAMMHDTMSKEQETRKLLAELKAIPVSEYAVNLAKYRRLLQLHPGNEKFIQKVMFYATKLNEKQAGYGY